MIWRLFFQLSFSAILTFTLVSTPKNWKIHQLVAFAKFNLEGTFLVKTHFGPNFNKQNPFLCIKAESNIILKYDSVILIAIF